jgi:two-component system LytT family sensor kinase
MPKSGFKNSGISLRLAAAVWAAWNLIGLFFTLQVYFSFSGTWRHLSFSDAFYSQMIDVQMNALSSVGVIWFSRRYRIERHNWRRRALVHLAGGLIVAALNSAFLAVVDIYFFQPWAAPVTLFFKVLLFSMDRQLYVYVANVFITHAYDYYKFFREGELKAAQLEAQLARARLDVLKSQLHPHYLFNTLNTISTMIHEDVEAADQMVANLGQFLRATLTQGTAQEVALEQELAMIDCYLQIELVRLHDRLTVDVDVPAALRSARVPSLILQPLVENAIRYGVAPYSAPGRVGLRVWRSGDMLHLRVCDSSQGTLEAARVPGHGVGLANTRARLRHLYGDAHSLVLRKAGPDGFTIDISIPYREG